jgi:hypothetical protein
MFINKRYFQPSSLALLAGIFLTPAAMASPIDPGFDLFHTPDGNGICGQNGGTTSCVNLGSVELPFFVPLKSNPFAVIDPALGPKDGLGNTDTIVQRTGSLPDEGTGIIDAELVALSLMSVSPIEFPAFDSLAPSFFDIFVVINQKFEQVNAVGSPIGLGNGNGICDTEETCKTLLSLPVTAEPSSGFLDITSHDAAGGMFNSSFVVFVDVYACAAGTGLGSESCFFAGTGLDLLTSTGQIWSHTPPPDYPINPIVGDPLFFPNGNFFPGPNGVVHQGPHPLVVPSSPIPEPAIPYLLAISIGLFGYSRRKTAFRSSRIAA